VPPAPYAWFWCHMLDDSSKLTSGSDHAILGANDILLGPVVASLSELVYNDDLGNPLVIIKCQRVEEPLQSWVRPCCDVGYRNHQFLDASPESDSPRWPESKSQSNAFETTSLTVDWHPALSCPVNF